MFGLESACRITNTADTHHTDYDHHPNNYDQLLMLLIRLLIVKSIPVRWDFELAPLLTNNWPCPTLSSVYLDCNAGYE